MSRALYSRKGRAGQIDPKEMAAALYIVERESRFDSHCTDPRSSAIGLGGFLSGTFKEFHLKRTYNEKVQAYLLLVYCRNRYHTFSRAAAHWRRFHYW